MSSKPESKNQSGVDLNEAARSGDEEAVATLIAIGSTSERIISEALAAAAEGGHATVVKQLLANPSVNPNFISASGMTPLRSAIAGGDGDCIQALLEAGADPNLETSRGTPLSCAAALGDVSSLELLVKKGALVDAISRTSGVTALMVASREDQREAVKQLLALGANPDLKSTEENGMSAVDVATAKGHAQVVSLLLQASIVRGVDEDMKANEASLSEARVSRDAASVRARSELKMELETSRMDKETKIESLKSENDDLRKKLGLSK